MILSEFHLYIFSLSVTNWAKGKTDPKVGKAMPDPL